MTTRWFATCLLLDGEGHYAEAAASGALGLTDLYFRLNVITAEMPPLRQRKRRRGHCWAARKPLIQCHPGKRPDFRRHNGPDDSQCRRRPTEERAREAESGPALHGPGRPSGRAAGRTKVTVSEPT